MGYEQSSKNKRTKKEILGTEVFVFFQTVFLNPDVRLQGGLLACSRLDQKIALNGLMELPGVTFDGEENGKKVVSMMNSYLSFCPFNKKRVVVG